MPQAALKAECGENREWSQRVRVILVRRGLFEYNIVGERCAKEILN